MTQVAANIENKSPDAAYVCKDNIVLMEDTVSGPLPATAQTQHATKMAAEATAKETRAALSYWGNVTGNVKRGK
jgi:hypothetical protein